MASAIAETIWPTRCVACDLPGTLLCSDCARKIPFIELGGACPHCGAPYGAVVCTECRAEAGKPLSAEDFAFAAARCAANYEGVAKRMVTAYKDGDEARLAPQIASCMLNALRGTQHVRTTAPRAMRDPSTSGVLRTPSAQDDGERARHPEQRASEAGGASPRDPLQNAPEGRAIFSSDAPENPVLPLRGGAVRPNGLTEGVIATPTGPALTLSGPAAKPAAGPAPPERGSTKSPAGAPIGAGLRPPASCDAQVSLGGRAWVRPYKFSNSKLPLRGGAVRPNGLTEGVIATPTDPASSWLAWTDALVAIPATPASLKRRGYDHMAPIVKLLSEWTGLPALAALRSHNAADQRLLSSEERAANRAGSFALAPGMGELPAHIVLVDDVLTTGATTSAAAAVLLDGGAAEVRVLTFARVW